MCACGWVGGAGGGECVFSKIKMVEFKFRKLFFHMDPSHPNADSVADEVSTDGYKVCCIWNQICPAELQNAVSLMYIKWAQCDI